MKYSRFNVFSKSRDSENYFIVNLLTGNADILGIDDAKKLKAFNKGEVLPDDDFTEELKVKGYLSEEAAEIKLYRSRYLDFLDARLIEIQSTD